MKSTLQRVYKEGRLDGDKITLDGSTYNAIVGKHAIYVPDLELKIIWSYNGKIEAYKDWDKGRNREAILDGTFGSIRCGFEEESLLSIANEAILIELLSEANMAPEFGGVVFIENFTSKFPFGIDTCDVKGKFGYLIKNASSLPTGSFTFENFKKLFINSGKIKASKGALNDLNKEGNTINGYLVDYRRTIWDMMKYYCEETIMEVASAIDSMYPSDEIKKRVSKLGQFPFKERSQSYETYLVDGEYQKGTRQTLYRYDKMMIDVDLKGKTLVDLGCCIGSMALEGYMRGARRVTGIDYQKEYIDCARMIACHNGMNVNFMVKDLNKPKEVSEYLNKLYKDPIDIVFALSLYKHVKENIWRVLDNINYKVCYVESHNAPDGFDTGHVKEMLRWINAKAQAMQVEYLGKTEDRSPRLVWRITKCDK